MELLEKIFSFLPKHLLKNIGLVCSRWKDAIHYSAVKLLMSCIKAGQLEEKQIARFGWRTSAAWDHDNDKCSCIDLAFNFFNKTNLGAPNGNRSAGNFGSITGTQPAREIQFALRYAF